MNSRPNLRTLNFQYAALKRLADVVKEGMAYAKEQHLAALLEDAEQNDGTQWAVKIDDEKVATVTLAGGKSSPRVTNEADLIAWAQDHHPDMVETRPRLTPTAAGTLKALVADYIDGEAVTEEGELIPGVTETTGAVYQSVRFTKTKSVDGKALMGDFIETIGVAGLIEDVAAQQDEEEN